MSSMRCLMFHLGGAMSSWGTAFTGIFRTSELHPTKSAIAGMISAALGIDRDDVEGQKFLYEDYDYVVSCADGAEKITDYHTVGTAKIPSKQEVIVGGYRRNELERSGQNTILSHREYVCNGYYSIFVIPHDGASVPLETLRDALEEPRYVLYLGRKSCPPSFPMRPEIVETDSLANLIVTRSFETFRNEKFVDSEYLSKHGGIRVYSTSELEGMDGLSVSRRRDDRADHSRWLFEDRTEYEYRVGTE